MKGFELGAVDYITKPLQQEEVLARVNTHLTIPNQQKKLESQKEELRQLNARKDKLLLNILPLKIVEDLKINGKPEPFEKVSFLFSYFVGFTEMSSILEPKTVINELSECLSCRLRNARTESRTCQKID